MSSVDFIDCSTPSTNEPEQIHPRPGRFGSLVVRVSDEQWAAMMPPDHAEWLARDGTAEAEAARKWFENLPELPLPTEKEPE